MSALTPSPTDFCSPGRNAPVEPGPVPGKRITLCPGYVHFFFLRIGKCNRQTPLSGLGDMVGESSGPLSLSFLDYTRNPEGHEGLP